MLQLPTAQISSKYQEYLNRKVELEARFGTFPGSGNRFVSNVSRETFNRVQESFSALIPPTIVRTTDCSMDVSEYTSIRRSTTIPQKENEVPVTKWIRKERIWNYPIRNYGIRLAMSLEEEISAEPNFQFTLIRTKDRYSYPLVGGVFRLDLTVVSMQSFQGPPGTPCEKQEAYGTDTTTYEIEVEVIDRTRLAEFNDVLERVLRLVQNTIIIYTMEQKDIMINYLNNLLGGRQISVIDSDVLVQARNLQLRDMVWGGLIGNAGTSYTVTHKADGIRKLLVFATSGLWLVMAPQEFTLLWREEFPGLTGTVLDGEIVPKSKRLPGAPSSTYWYLVFDCLVDAGDWSIQNRPHRQRMDVAQAIANRFKNQLITVTTKTFVTLDSVENFYSIMQKMFDEQPSLSYQQDGFMFTPEAPPYNPHSEKNPLDHRILTRIPDLCKWKPKQLLTIDFMISWRAVPPSDRYPRGRVIDLYANYNGKPVPFTGTEINPFSGPDQVDVNNPLTLNVPQGSIVEYRFDYEEEILVPVRIRTDKIKPNRLDIAKANWDWIHDPIEAETMQGKTFELVWKYHNRIKRALYNSVIPYTPRPPESRPRGRGPTQRASPRPKPQQEPLNLTLLDIGSGRGGDVSKWRSFRKIVAVEPDNEKIKELVRRANLHGMTPILYNEVTPETNLDNYRILVVQTGGQNTSLISQAVQRFIGRRVDIVSLMLSMTFFWQSAELVTSLANTIQNNIKPDGTILFMTLDGETVSQMFDPAIRGVKQNFIKLGPMSMELQGHQLIINIPGSIVGEQVEWLVNIYDLLIRLNGFTLSEIHRATTELFLSPQELLYTQMYSFGYLTGSPMAIPPPLLTGPPPVQQYPLPLLKPPALPSQPAPSPKGRPVPKGQPTPSPKGQPVPKGQPTPSPKGQPVPKGQPAPYPKGRPVSTEVPVPKEPSIKGPTVPAPPTVKIPAPPTVKIPTSPVPLSPTVKIPAPPTVKIPTSPVPLSPTVKAPPSPTVKPPPPSTIKIPPSPVPLSPTVKAPTPKIPTLVTLPSVGPQTTLVPPSPQIPKIANKPVVPTAWEDKNIIDSLPTYKRSQPGEVGDDLYQPMTCSWYTNVVRIAALGEGSCFFHAVCKGFFRIYQNAYLYRDRTLIVSELRRDLAAVLADKDDDEIPTDESVIRRRQELGYLGNQIPVNFPYLINYETASNGAFVEFYSVEEAAGQPVVYASFGRVPVSFSLEGVQRLIGSNLDVGNEVFSYVTEMLGIDIYILEARTNPDDLYVVTKIVQSDIDENEERFAVVILHVAGHYEVIAIDTPAGFQTAFPRNDPFLLAFNIREAYLNTQGAADVSVRESGKAIQARHSIQPATRQTLLNTASNAVRSATEALVSAQNQAQRVNTLIEKFRNITSSASDAPWIVVARQTLDLMTEISTATQAQVTRAQEAVNAAQEALTVMQG